MTEFLLQLLYLVLTVMMPVLINCLVNWIRAKTEQTEYEQIADIVADAVEETNQTFVDELKKAGAFDLEAQATALEKSVSTVVARLSDMLTKYIKKTGADVEEYITTLIESYIKVSKSS